MKELSMQEGAPSETLANYIARSVAVLQHSVDSIGAEKMEAAIAAITKALAADLPLLVCGNGGSASDAQHITGELVGRFLKERRALNAICLSANMATITALGNDYGYEQVFARQVEAYGKRGGVLLGLSTSGNSKNMLEAFARAKEMGMATIALTGEGGGKLASLSDILLAAASPSTPLVQQVHLCLYHYICEHVEVRLAA